MIVVKFYCLCIINLCVLGHVATAGSNYFGNKSVSGIYHYGYVWAHRTRVEHLTTGHTQGLEFSFQTQTIGNKGWQRVHGYPQTGISLAYFDLANPQIIGNATTLIGYVNLPFIRTRNFLFAFQAGAGLAYLSRRFDPVTDHKNMGIGSHLNSTIRVNFQTRFRLTDQLFFHLNYGITHFSNGAFRLPNLGINNVSLNGGFSYAFSKPQDFLKPGIPSLDKRWITEIVYGAGVKENYPPDGKQYFAHTFYLNFLKPLSHKSRIAIGADAFYDLSLARFVKEASSAGEKNVKTIRSGIHTGYEMPLNKITLLVHIGYYLLDQTGIDGSFYHRYGLKYEPGRHLFINLSLKSHWARADFTELGIGWRFR